MNKVKISKSVICITLLVLASTFLSLAQGYRGIGEQPLNKKLMELPAISSEDIILVYNGFVVNYNDEKHIPNWVAYELTAEETRGKIPRAKGFSMDLDYKGVQALREDYSNTGWDKGHMAPSADMKWSQTAMNESFYLTNVCHQNHDLNGKSWHSLEKKVRDWAIEYGHVYVVCGPYFTDNDFNTIGINQVAVPNGFFKAILRQSGTEYYSIAFVFNNSPEKQPLKDAIISVNDVEQIIGYDLFTNLSNRYEESVESQQEWDHWN